MGHFLANFYTVPCGITLLIGFFGRLWYCRAKAKRLDKIEPLPGGAKHVPDSFNRVVVSIFVGVLMFGYLIMKAQGSEDRGVAAQQTADRVTAQLKSCVIEFQHALKIRSDMAGKDAELSNAISDLRSDLDYAQGEFMKQRLNPPANIVGLPETDPRRAQWREDITASFANWQARIRDKIAVKVDERKKLTKDRADNPLPEFNC